MDKYALLNRTHCDRRLQVYMHAFIYVNPEIISVRDYFPDTKTIVKNYNKTSTLEPVPKHWFGFSYISSEDHELNVNFDETELKNNQTTHSTIKLNHFAKILW